MQSGRKILLKGKAFVPGLDGLVLGGFGLCSTLATQPRVLPCRHE